MVHLARALRHEGKKEGVKIGEDPKFTPFTSSGKYPASAAAQRPAKRVLKQSEGIKCPTVRALDRLSFDAVQGGAAGRALTRDGSV